MKFRCWVQPAHRVRWERQARSETLARQETPERPDRKERLEPVEPTVLPLIVRRSPRAERGQNHLGRRSSLLSCGDQEAEELAVCQRQPGTGKEDLAAVAEPSRRQRSTHLTSGLQRRSRSVWEEQAVRRRHPGQREQHLLSGLTLRLTVAEAVIKPMRVTRPEAEAAERRGLE